MYKQKLKTWSQAFVQLPTSCLPSSTSDCLQNNPFLFIVFDGLPLWGVRLSKAIVHQDLCSHDIVPATTNIWLLAKDHFLFNVFMITGVCTKSSLQPKQNLTIVVIAILTKYCVVSSANHLQNQQNIQLYIVLYYKICFMITGLRPTSSVQSKQNLDDDKSKTWHHSCHWSSLMVLIIIIITIIMIIITIIIITIILIVSYSQCSFWISKSLPHDTATSRNKTSRI